MNERRGFGRLEAVFILMAIGYLVYAVFFSNGNPGENPVAVAEAATSVPIVEMTWTPEPPRPTLVPTVASAATSVPVVENPGTAAQFRTRAEARFAARDFGGALADYERVMSLAPNNAAALAGRAAVYLELGLLDMALADAREAIERESSTAAYHVLRGDIHRAREEFTEAESAYLSALINEAFNPDAFFGLGMLHVAEDDDVAALQDLLVATNSPFATAEHHYELGQLYERADVPDAALSSYTTAIEINPDYYEAYIVIIDLYEAQGDYAATIPNYTEAIRLRPENDVLSHNRGFAYNQIGEYQRAVADYTAAIALDPDDPVSLGGRGVAHSNLNDFDAAFADYNRALELDPNDEIILYNRGRSFADTGDYEAAVADYTAAIDLQDPSEIALDLRSRGEAYIALENFEAAVDDLLVATELSPNNRRGWQLLGDAYVGNGQLDLAEAAYQQYITVTREAGLEPDMDVLSRLGAAVTLTQTAAITATTLPEATVAPIGLDAAVGALQSYAALREQQAPDSPIITVLSPGQKVTLLERHVCERDLRVSFEGRIGWISASTIQTEYPLNTLPELGIENENTDC